jgi:hypothetical protein
MSILDRSQTRMLIDYFVETDDNNTDTMYTNEADVKANVGKEYQKIFRK